MAAYTKEELSALYELGRLYFEMGYLAPAERIFSGLSGIDQGQTCSRLGLGLVKMEKGLFEEAIAHLRTAAQTGGWELESKIALSAAFLGAGEIQRAQSLLAEIGRAIQSGKAAASPEVKEVFEALLLCAVKKQRPEAPS